MYVLYMARLPLSEVRRRLPELVRKAEQGGIVEITNRGRVVARLVAPANDLGTTADILLALRARPGRRPPRRPRDVSSHKNDHLVGTRR
jgi:prevent-host-death family protein